VFYVNLFAQEEIVT